MHEYPLPRWRWLVAAGLRGPGLAALGLGVPFLFFPQWMHDDFPLGRGWLLDISYSEHLMRELGGLYLGAALLLLLLPVASPTRIRRLVLASWLVAAIPHLLIHALAEPTLPVADQVTQLTLLTILVLLPLAAIFVPAEPPPDPPRVP